MKSDSYPRFLRSNVYQDLLMAKKKVSVSVISAPVVCFLYVFAISSPQQAVQQLKYIRALIRRLQRSRFQLRQLIASVLEEIIKCNAASVERWHISKQLGSKH